jgi:glycosyltransferase involved in cell wall biosynthesis
MDLSPARAGRYGRAAARWGRLVMSGRARPGVRVFYGHDRIPAPGERAAGGTVKMQKLNERFPNSPTDFSVLYIGTTWVPRDLGPLLRVARRRGAAIVVNQDGVGYPGWAGDRAEEVNRPLRRCLQAADHVLYQSAFSKVSSDLFLGEPECSWEIRPNAVDVERFTPAPSGPPRGDYPVLLRGGDQTQAYRLELGLETLAALSSTHPNAQLLVTGRLVSPLEPRARKLGVRDRVHLLGEYGQRDAPAIFQRAHVLLHTKVKDPCPTLVIEAMACGLPAIATEYPGVKAVIDEDVTGLLVPPGDAAAVARALDQLGGDETLRRRLGAAGRAKAEQEWSWPRLIERMDAAYAEAIEARRAKVGRRAGNVNHE